MAMAGGPSFGGTFGDQSPSALYSTWFQTQAPYYLSLQDKLNQMEIEKYQQMMAAQQAAAQQAIQNIQLPHYTTPTLNYGNLPAAPDISIAAPPTQAAPTWEVTKPDVMGLAEKVAAYYDQYAQKASQGYMGRANEAAATIGQQMAEKARRQGVWGMGPEAEWGKTFAQEAGKNAQIELANIAAKAALGQAAALGSGEIANQGMTNWQNQAELQNQVANWQQQQNYNNQLWQNQQQNSLANQYANHAYQTQLQQMQNQYSNQNALAQLANEQALQNAIYQMNLANLKPTGSYGGSYGGGNNLITALMQIGQNMHMGGQGQGGSQIANSGSSPWNYSSSPQGKQGADQSYNGWGTGYQSKPMTTEEYNKWYFNTNPAAGYGSAIS